MNRGNIPGFYYDEERKKYFKITADHKLPAGAKHSKSNAAFEQQKAKKRKLEIRADRKLRAQTTSRSKILQLPEVTGIGLRREIGLSSISTTRAAADAAFVSQFQLHKARHGAFDETDVKVLSAFPMPSRNRTLVTTQWLEQGMISSSCVYPRNILQQDDPAWRAERITWVDPYIGRVMAFGGPVTALAVWPRNDPQTVVACANSTGHNIFVGSIVQEDTSGRATTLGNDESTLWDTALDPTGAHAAIAGGNFLCLYELGKDTVKSRDKIRNCRAVDWLTPTLMLAGESKNIVLWDTRTRGGGISKRFTNDNTVTGIQTVPAGNSNQVLASSNHSLSLFDLRMPSNKKRRPLLSIPNLSEAPKLNFDISTRGIVATSEKAGPSTQLRLISLTSGQDLRTLKLPTVSPFQPSQIAWFPDERGVEYLSVCSGSWVYKWSWDELGDEG